MNAQGSDVVGPLQDGIMLDQYQIQTMSISKRGLEIVESDDDDEDAAGFHESSLLGF